jgi:hypothetical protein
MITVPDQVARQIFLERIHPVTAWRNYYKIDIKSLSIATGLKEFEITRIESSNLHLEENNLMLLCKAFNIVPEALEVRYISKLN